MNTKQWQVVGKVLGVLSFVLFIWSCEPNCETEVFCENMGIPQQVEPDSCVCACPIGYGGDMCESLDRWKFTNNDDTIITYLGLSLCNSSAGSDSLITFVEVRPSSSLTSGLDLLFSINAIVDGDTVSDQFTTSAAMHDNSFSFTAEDNFANSGFQASGEGRLQLIPRRAMYIDFTYTGSGKSNECFSDTLYAIP